MQVADARNITQLRATQRFDSTKFYDTTPFGFGTVGAIEPPLFVVRLCNGQQIDSTSSLRRKPVWKVWCYRTAVLRFGKRSGSITPN